MKLSLAVVIIVSTAGSAVAQNRNIGNPNTTVNPTISPNINTSPSATGGQGGTGQGGTAGATSSASPASTSSAGGGTLTVTTNTNVPSDQIVRTAPPIYVPSVATGNVCALGASGGASWLGAGFAFGSSWESMQCERRQQAALLWNMNTPESRAAAKEILCNTAEIRAAYAMVGSPCKSDLMRVAGPAGAPQPPLAVVAPQPASQPVPPPQAKPFNAARYARSADCLTAAYTSGAPLALCAGKP